MNCFLLLVLLSCCRRGNSCSCNSSRSSCCRTERRGCCHEAKREMSGRECCSGMDSRRNDSCGRDMGRQAECCECEEERRGGCGCEEERRGRGGCGCEEEHYDHGDCGCTERENIGDGPGMIPPPWQEYPRFPRRDRGEECDG